MVNNCIPIAPTLKKMEKYASVEFSLRQYTSVNSAIQRIQTEYPTLKFVQKKNKENQTLRVTRTN